MAHTATRIGGYKELRVYAAAMEAAMRIFKISKGFPKEERFSLTDQIRKSSRSVCANLAEAWRNRRYQAHFVSKLSDAEGEAGETRVWLEFAQRCGYMSQDEASELDFCFDRIIAQLVKMIYESSRWTVGRPQSKASTTPR